MSTAPLSIEQLKSQIENGTIDTVIVAITDMQGRLQGKRIHAPFFLADTVKHGTEGCNYLLAVDVDMNTVDGYAMSYGIVATETLRWSPTLTPSD